MLNFTATDLQLYNTFKITRVIFWDTVYMCIVDNASCMINMKIAT